MDFWMWEALDGAVNAFEFVAAGLGVGTVFGLFGAGGSAFATPILALMGVPPVLAVASPLPAMLPASLTGARRHVQNGSFDRRVALLAIAGGVPGTAAGALLSSAIGGNRLLFLSAAMLLVVGARVAMPDRDRHAAACALRRANAPLLVGTAFAVGLLTGLLANGGGFLLVPLFIIGFGLAAGEAAGTSMLVVGVLTIPTLVTHWSLGHIDWPVAIAFAVGMIPGSLVGASLSSHVADEIARRAFGVVLVVFAIAFVALQVV
ncbi:MAG: sulfite exporter TauE/SafE family protein [Acidimicrobiia bacterium]